MTPFELITITFWFHPFFAFAALSITPPHPLARFVTKNFREKFKAASRVPRHGQKIQLNFTKLPFTNLLVQYMNNSEFELYLNSKFHKQHHSFSCQSLYPFIIIAITLVPRFQLIISRISISTPHIGLCHCQKREQEDPCKLKARVVGDATYCDRYWECVDGQPELYDCPNGLVFAGKNRGVTEGCDYPWRSQYCVGKQTASEISPCLSFN